jgi:hypothetical protein
MPEITVEEQQKKAKKEPCYTGSSSKLVANYHSESVTTNEDSAGLNLGQLTGISGLY